MGRPRTPDRPDATDRRPAVTPRRHEDHLLAALLRHYDADRPFRRELLALIPFADAAIAAVGPLAERSRMDLLSLDTAEPDPRWHGMSEVDELLGKARELLECSGLERLGDRGLRLVLAWCDRYVAARRSSVAPSTYGPGSLSTVRYDIRFEPEVVGIVPPPWDREEWSPAHEPRAVARERLEAKARRAVQTALDAIEKEVEARGLLRQPRAVPNLERDVQWLYQTLRWRRSYQTIFDRLRPPPPGGVDTIRKAVERAARRLGIDTSGWETGWR